MKSTVKKYFKDKGYGFIENGAGRDVYVNQHELANCKFLRPGVEVEFEIHVVGNKLVAKSVRLVHQASQPNQHNAVRAPQGNGNSQYPSNHPFSAKNEQPRFVMT